MSQFIRVISLSIAACFLSSCGNLNHLPSSYKGPTATIFQAPMKDSEKRNCGMVLAIDNKNYNMAGLGVSSLKDSFRIEAGTHRLLLRGHVVYFSELRNLAKQSYAEDWVTVRLKEGGRYVVKTRTDASGTSVWLEESEFERVISPVVRPNKRG
ncbi:MAG: hypothetical protein IPK32_26020 [Verrucomicrobiaceae bacterium]|nr:hypothetical protein [Verrucomicrobiaceae bacterium]